MDGGRRNRKWNTTERITTIDLDRGPQSTCAEHSVSSPQCRRKSSEGRASPNRDRASKSPTESPKFFKREIAKIVQKPSRDAVNYSAGTRRRKEKSGSQSTLELALEEADNVEGKSTLSLSESPERNSENFCRVSPSRVDRRAVTSTYLMRGRPLEEGGEGGIKGEGRGSAVESVRSSAWLRYDSKGQVHYHKKDAVGMKLRPVLNEAHVRSVMCGNDVMLHTLAMSVVQLISSYGTIPFSFHRTIMFFFL